MTNKKKIAAALLAVGLYLLLMEGLVAAESMGSDPSITGLGDAIWFSVVTLTTVGYGDMSPATLPGRIIGIILVLCSLGLLSFIITGMLAFLSGHTIPLLQLRALSDRRWNIFLGRGREACCLAGKLEAEDPGCVSLFLTEEGEQTIRREDARRFAVTADLLWLIGQKKRRDENADIRIFCLAADGWSNYSKAAARSRQLKQQKNICIYCRTAERAEQHDPGLVLFDYEDSLARDYWSRYPLHRGEQQILIIGSDGVGTRLLERALLTNVFEPDRRTDYLLAGDGRAFENSHYEFFNKAHLTIDADGQRVYVAGEEPYDRVTFCDRLTALRPQQILEADRIILCSDRADDNRAVCHELRESYPLKGQIYLRQTGEDTAAGPQGVLLFGSDTEIFVPEMVMQNKRNALAVSLNEAYRQTVRPEERASKAPDWENLSEFKRQSNIAAADHLPVKARFLLGDEEADRILREAAPGKEEEELFAAAYAIFLTCTEEEEKMDLLRHIEHNRWMRFHCLHNWRQGKRDNARRIHDLLIPHEQVPYEIQKYDDNAWAALGEKLKN